MVGNKSTSLEVGEPAPWLLARGVSKQGYDRLSRQAYDPYQQMILDGLWDDEAIEEKAKGDEYFRNSEYRAAVACYGRALERNPDSYILAPASSMAINQIGDQVRAHLAGLFSTDASSPAAKQAKKKPQAKWLQAALGDTFAVFGGHVKERFVGIELDVASVSEQVNKQEGQIKEALNLKQTVQDLQAERRALKDARDKLDTKFHGMVAAPVAEGANEEAHIRKDMEELRKQVEQQTAKTAEVPYEMRKVCICGGLGWDTPPEALQERCWQVLDETGLQDQVETVAATLDTPGCTCEVVLRNAGTMGPARLRVRPLGKSFVANKKVWFDAKRSRAENALARMMHKSKEYLEAAAIRDRAVVNLTTRELSDALAGLRHVAVVNKNGIAVAALRLLCESRPGAVYMAFFDLASSRGEMGSLVIMGRASATGPGTIPPTAVRTIPPLPVVLAVVDNILAKRVRDVVDRCAARVLPAASMSPCLECAESRRQTLDAVHPLALVIERGMGNESQGCACQQGARECCDAPRAMRVARWFRDETGSCDEAATLVKLHACPLVVLEVGSALATLSSRVVGVRSGSRSAGAAGRTPLLDLASQRMHFWQTLGFEGAGLAYFVDNLLAAPKDPAAAVLMQDDCAEQLSRRWDLQIGGGGSREYLICKGGRDDVVSHRSWDKKEKTLGHIIDHKGGITSCYAAATAAMLRAFVGNLDQDRLLESGVGEAQVSWESHIRRGRDPQAWTPRVLRYRGAVWLSWQRLIALRGQESWLAIRRVRGPDVGMGDKRGPTPKATASLADTRSGEHKDTCHSGPMLRGARPTCQRGGHAAATLGLASHTAGGGAAAACAAGAGGARPRCPEPGARARAASALPAAAAAATCAQSGARLGRLLRGAGRVRGARRGTRARRLASAGGASGRGEAAHRGPPQGGRHRGLLEDVVPFLHQGQGASAGGGRELRVCGVGRDAAG
ncbi:unnamed protein product [Prorocentrum cordatum]|uniref:Uncharacterized protein n=1 Tax=Prorocentrum cordatum TaxID=2364126 RepID=A0ABN9SEY2_9DINO|nr:unnamed protein product [Polarella glacialis]